MSFSQKLQVLLSKNRSNHCTTLDDLQEHSSGQEHLDHPSRNVGFPSPPSDIQERETTLPWEGHNLIGSGLDFAVSQEKPFLWSQKRSQWLWYKNLVIPSIRIGKVDDRKEIIEPLTVKVDCWKEFPNKCLEKMPIEGLTSSQMRNDGIVLFGLKFIETTFVSKGSQFYLTVTIEKTDAHLKSPSRLPQFVFISQPIYVEARRKRKNLKNCLKSKSPNKAQLPTILSINQSFQKSPHKQLYSSYSQLTTVIDLQENSKSTTTTSSLKALTRIPAIRSGFLDNPRKQLCIEAQRPPKYLDETEILQFPQNQNSTLLPATPISTTLHNYTTLQVSATPNHKPLPRQSIDSLLLETQSHPSPGTSSTTAISLSSIHLDNFPVCSPLEKTSKLPHFLKTAGFKHIIS